MTASRVGDIEFADDCQSSGNCIPGLAILLIIMSTLFIISSKCKRERVFMLRNNMSNLTEPYHTQHRLSKNNRDIAEQEALLKIEMTLNSHLSIEIYINSS